MPSKYHIFIIVFSVLSTIMLMLLAQPLWLRNDPATLSFDAEGAGSVNFQLFYAGNKTNFSEDLSVKKNVNLETTRKVQIEIPTTDVIEKLRLDFDAASINLTLSSIKINDIAIDCNQLIFQHIDKHQILKDGLNLSSVRVDPGIVFLQELQVSGRKKVQIGEFFIISLLSFLIAYKILYSLAKHVSKCESVRKVDVCLVCAFFILLFIPMTDISNATRSLSENRALAPYKAFLIDGKINKKFGENFESWFNDHFFGRDVLIQYYSNIIAIFNPQPNNDKVFFGRDRWLFYKMEGSIGNFQNSSVFTKQEIINITKYLTDIEKWCKKHNKQFYLFIGPDKHRVYGEFYPRFINKVKSDTENKTNVLLSYLEKHSQIKVIYPLDELLDAKPQGLLYWKQDTHWSSFGGNIAFQVLTKEIQQDFSDLMPYTASFTGEKYARGGDLQLMVAHHVEVDSDAIYLQSDRAKNYTGGQRQNTEVTSSTHKDKDRKYRAFIGHDSFVNCILPYFCNTFAKAKFTWSYQLTHEDLEDIKNNYDIVILSCVERNIPLLNTTFPSQ